MSAERIPLRTLIGGRWAVSWQGYLIGWPWAVLFIFFGAPSLWVSDSIAEGLIRGVVFGTITYIPVGIGLWIASVTVLRNRRTKPVSIVMIALVGGVAWTLRTFVVLAVIEVQGLSSDFQPTTRFVSGFVQGVIATVLTAWLLAKFSNFHQQRRQLLSELVNEELGTEQLRDRIEIMRQRVLDTVRASVDETAETLSEKRHTEGPSSSDVEALSNATRQLSKKLARELWDDAATSARVNPTSVLRSAVANRPFAYWGLLPIIVIALILLPVFWTFADTAITLAILSAFALIVSVVANAVTPRVTMPIGLVVYGCAIVLLLATGILIHIPMDLLGLSAPSGNVLPWSSALNFGVLYPLIGLAAHIGRAQQEVLDQLRQSISDGEVTREALRREESRMRRDLAYALHGGLQSDLTASAIRVQKAIDEGDTTTARETLGEAKTVIERGWVPTQSIDADLRDTAREVVDSWEGIVDITLDVDVTSEPDPRTIAHIEAVLLEGIGNAVRHGLATHIDIAITECDGTLQITITDDGLGVTGDRTGLGTEMFDEIAPNRWSLQPVEPGGATLTVMLRALKAPIA